MIQLWIRAGDADIFKIMKRKYALPHFIRRTGIWLGLFAMVLQSLAAISHGGVMAAVVAGNLQPLTGVFGLLQICTPRGIVGLDPRQQAPASPRSAEKPCPLCSASALNGFTFARHVIIPSPLNRQVALNVVPFEILRFSFLSGRKGLSRAPPVLI